MTSLRRACGVSSFGRLPVPCPPAPAAFFWRPIMSTQRSNKSKGSRPSVADPSLRIANPHAAGIDVHARAHWVCVPASSVSCREQDQPANLPANVRAFGTCTPDLEQLADWLLTCGVTTIAMEATGVYWIA